MASVKLATLAIRTAAKPISNRIKQQAKEHESFRNFCVSLAQTMYRTEVRLRQNFLGEPAKHIRPLSETRAIENGANFIAEGFLFTVAAGLIMAETWRSSRSASKRRDSVDESLEELTNKVKEIQEKLSSFEETYSTKLDEEKQRNDDLARILERIVETGLRGGWAEFESTPLQIPRISLSRATSMTKARQQNGNDTVPEQGHEISTSSSSPSSDNISASSSE